MTACMRSQLLWRVQNVDLHLSTVEPKHLLEAIKVRLIVPPADQLGTCTAAINADSTQECNLQVMVYSVARDTATTIMDAPFTMIDSSWGQAK